MGTNQPATLELGMLIDENANSQEHEHSANSGPIWGRLLPLGNGFSTIELKENEYLFGRGEDVTVSLNNSILAEMPYFPAFSKLHFTIKRENSDVYIIDNSSNGTFLNGEKIGKNIKRPLCNNDEISLPVKKARAFVYMECGANDSKNFPQSLREKYDISRTIGKGAMGEDTSKQIQREIEILKSVKYPCIISIEDVLDTDDNTYLVLELVEGGELFDRIISATKLAEKTAKLIFYQIFLAVKYLHDLGITHRDLKPENILLSSDAEEPLIKITDFGLSKFVDGESMLKTFCGTPNYLAPEVLLSSGVGVYTKAVDLWSVGVILFVALSGYPPFSSDYTDMNIGEQIKTGRYKFFKKSWEGVSETAIDLVKKLIEVDPEKRLTVDQALNHSWLLDNDVKQKAHLLMYPNSDGMIPPRLTTKMSPQKRSRMETDEEDVTTELNGNNRKKFAP